METKFRPLLSAWKPKLSILSQLEGKLQETKVFKKRLISLLYGPPGCWYGYMATRVSTKHYLDSEHSSSITRRLVVFPGSTTSLLPEHCRIYTVSVKIKKNYHTDASLAETCCTWNKDKVDAVHVINLREGSRGGEQQQQQCRVATHHLVLQCYDWNSLKPH